MTRNNSQQKMNKNLTLEIERIKQQQNEILNRIAKTKEELRQLEEKYSLMVDVASSLHCLQIMVGK